MDCNRTDPPSRWLSISQGLVVIGSIVAGIGFGTLLQHQAHELAVRTQLRHALRLTMADHSLGSDRLMSRDGFQLGEFTYLGEWRGEVYVMTVSAGPGSHFHGQTLSGCVELPSGRIDIEAGFTTGDTGLCPTNAENTAGGDAVTRAPAPPGRRHGG